LTVFTAKVGASTGRPMLAEQKFMNNWCSCMADSYSTTGLVAHWLSFLQFNSLSESSLSWILDLPLILFQIHSWLPRNYDPPMLLLWLLWPCSLLSLYCCIYAYKNTQGVNRIDAWIINILCSSCCLPESDLLVLLIMSTAVG
jgi:hypothetical protein